MNINPACKGHPFSRFVCWQLVLLSLLLPCSLLADIKFTMTPAISVSETYDDNIFLAPQLAEDDFITTISPSLQISGTAPSSTFSLRYSPLFVYYSDNSQLNNVFHVVSAELQHSFSKHFNISLSETFTMTDDSLEFDRDSQAVTQRRPTFYRNTATAVANYQYGKRDSLQLGYQYSSLDSDEDEAQITLNTSDQYRLFGSLDYWFDIRNGLDFNGSFSQTSFMAETETADTSEIIQNTRKVDSYNAGAGYTYRFNPQTDLRLGYQLDIQDADTVDDSGNLIHTGNLLFKHQFNKETSIGLGSGYYYRDADDGRDYSGATLSTDISYTKDKLRLSAGGRYGWDEDFLDIEARGFTRFAQASSGIDYQFTTKFNTFASVSYRRNENLADEVSQNYRARCGLGLRMTKWLVFNLEYQFAQQLNDDPEDEYENNRVLASFSASRTIPWKR